MTDLLIGADPELFVRNKDGFISAHGLVPGDKYSPYFVQDGAVQVDGMALEFNINPAKNQIEFKNNINSVLRTLRKMVPQELDLVVSPIASFEKEYMKGLPRSAVALGCLPDFNAYTGKINPAPSEESRLRTAAGHIHLGWTEDQNPKDKDHFNMCIKIAKELDWTLGVPSILDDQQKGSSVRRKMYGRAGAFRPKPYGMEYRVLSNYWLLSDHHMLKVYNNSKIAYYNVLKDRSCSTPLLSMLKRSGCMYNFSSAESIINTNNKKSAQYAVSYLNLYSGSEAVIGGSNAD